MSKEMIDAVQSAYECATQPIREELEDAMDSDGVESDRYSQIEKLFDERQKVALPMLQACRRVMNES